MIDFYPPPFVRDYYAWCVDPAWNPDAPEPVPALVREVCDCCNGTGTTWLGRPRGDAVVFCADEWNYMHPDEQDEWMDGTYDRPCPECEGRRVIDVPTPTGTPAGVWKAWEDHCEREWADARVAAQEIAMGC